MIEYRGTMAGIGDSSASPQINPITPKMDAMLFHSIFQQKFAILNVGNHFTMTARIISSNLIITISDGLAICYGYRCMFSNSTQFLLPIPPQSSYYHIYFNVDLRSTIAKFSIVCSDVSNKSTIDLRQDNLALNYGVFQILLGTVFVNNSNAELYLNSELITTNSVDQASTAGRAESCSLADFATVAESVNDIKLSFDPLSNDKEIKVKINNNIYNLETKKLLFNSENDQSDVYKIFKYGILALNVPSNLSYMKNLDVSKITLKNSVQVGDVLEFVTPTKIHRYVVHEFTPPSGSAYKYIDFEETTALQEGISFTIARLIFTNNELSMSNSAWTNKYRINSLSNSVTMACFNPTDNSTFFSLSISKIYKVIAGEK